MTVPPRPSVLPVAAVPPVPDAGQTVRHVKPPRQARSRRTLDRIVRAALGILEAEGPDGITVQAVVARARSSVGSFYARFAGKEELLDYLGEHVWDEARARWDEALAERAWADLSLSEVVDGAVRLLVDAHGSRASYLRALDRAGGRDGFAAFRLHVLAGLAELMLERRDDITHPQPDVAVHFGLAAVSGAIDTVESSASSSADMQVREGRALLMAYLAGTAGEPPDDQEVDFFDVWG